MIAQAPMITTIAANDVSGQTKITRPIATPSTPRTSEFTRSVATGRSAKSLSLPLIDTHAISTIEAVPASDGVGNARVRAFSRERPCHRPAGLLVAAP